MAKSNNCEALDDAALIHAYAKGDEKAFEVLYYRLLINLKDILMIKKTILSNLLSK